MQGETNTDRSLELSISIRMATADFGPVVQYIMKRIRYILQ